MRALLLSGCLLLSLGLPGMACATEGQPSIKLSSQQCGVSTPYDVLVDGGGIWLRKPDATPREIVFHNGELSVDGQMQTLGAADVQRLRAMEAGVRQLMPAVTGLARESVGISFDVLDSTIEIMTGSTSTRKTRKLRRQAEHYVDQTIGRGRWEQDLFAEGLERQLEAAAESLSGTLMRGVLWSLMTGGAGRMEARADRVDAKLDQRMQERAQALEAHAQSLCIQVLALNQLQSSLDYRYQGNPLPLMTLSAQNSDAITEPREQGPDDRIALPSH